MQNLFLINNKSEYCRSLAVIKKQNLQDSIILSIDKKEPFFVDILPNLEQIARWSDFNVNDIQTAWYWMANYREIESLARDAAQHTLNDQIVIKNPYLLFKLTFVLGHQHLRHYVAAVVFLKSQKPAVVHTARRSSFVADVIKNVAVRYGILVKDLK